VPTGKEKTAEPRQPRTKLLELLEESLAVSKLLDPLTEKPEVAWDQLKFLVWRSDLRLVLRLQESAPTAGCLNEEAFLELDYMEVSSPSLYREYDIVWTPVVNLKFGRQHLRNVELVDRVL